MATVYAEISMSLDGLITGPNVRVDNGLGDGGERLHEWLFPPERNFEDTARQIFQHVGAIIMGRNMFRVGEAPWGVDPPFHMPVFVVTHHFQEPIVKLGGTVFHFVSDGIESAVQQARAAAGEKDVQVAGGAQVIQQCLQTGLLDALQIHLIPILLGSGIRLFENLGTAIELQQESVVAAPGVTHLRYRAGSKNGS